MRSLLLLVLTPVLLGRSAPPDGPTLFPAPVCAGETLRFVTGAVIRECPGGADTVRVAPVGDTIVVRESERVDDLLWIGLEGGGWAPAASLDRFPHPLAGDLPPGREGLGSGRVLPWDWRPSDLVALPDSSKYPGYEGKALRLRSGAAEAFEALVAAAREDGILILAFSAWRGAADQRRLYARALRRDPGQRWSAAPGRSEHQLGTTVDVAPPTLTPLDPALAEAPAGEWLRRRAAAFGFVISFSRERHRARGVVFEPWHLRWVAGEVENPALW